MELNVSNGNHFVEMHINPAHVMYVRKEKRHGNSHYYVRFSNDDFFEIEKDDYNRLVNLLDCMSGGL